MFKNTIAKYKQEISKVKHYRKLIDIFERSKKVGNVPTLFLDKKIAIAILRIHEDCSLTSDN